jgi:DNA replication protein DnaC
MKTGEDLALWKETVRTLNSLAFRPRLSCLKNLSIEDRQAYLNTLPVNERQSYAQELKNVLAVPFNERLEQFKATFKAQCEAEEERIQNLPPEERAAELQRKVEEERIQSLSLKEQLAEQKRKQEEARIRSLTPEERKQEEHKAMILSCKNLGIPPRYYEVTWDNFITDTPEKQEALRLVRTTAWNRNLLLSGKHGTGKTHLAMCLAKEGATYRKLADIYRKIRCDPPEEAVYLEQLSTVKLLILDESGLQKFSDFEMNLLARLINKRWNNIVPTMIITNLTLTDFNEIIKERIMDRFRPKVIFFNWKSYRKDPVGDGEGV